MEAFGRIDSLVNNAGVQPLQPLETVTLQQWEEVHAVNINGTFNIPQAAAKSMIETGGGSITNIASVEASLPAPNHAHYTSSKAAAKMFARAATLEYGKYGIRVNSVSPGLIDRGDLDESWPQGRDSWLRKCPLGRVGTPIDVAYACVFLASDMASWAAGVDMGRNIFQRKDPAAMIKAVRGVVHDRLSAADGYALYRELSAGADD